MLNQRFSSELYIDLSVYLWESFLFFPHTGRLWNSLLIECLHLTNAQKFIVKVVAILVFFAVSFFISFSISSPFLTHFIQPYVEPFLESTHFPQHALNVSGWHSFPCVKFMIFLRPDFLLC